MRFSSVIAGGLLAACLVPGETPLPSVQELKTRALINMKKSEKALEKYSCIVNEQIDELRGDGSVKSHHTKKQERFYVNGTEINHVLAKGGKPLADSDAEKEQERVDKEVKKYSDPTQVQKKEAEREKQTNTFVAALRFENEHREMRKGRNTIVYDLSGNPNFHPKNIEGTFAQALAGKIWLDEETGTPVELRIRIDHDVKIGGGLLANVHEGSRFYLVQQRQPDGAWVIKSLGGDGDARAALFLHPRFRFRQELDECRLFSVDAKETARHP